MWRAASDARTVRLQAAFAAETNGAAHHPPPPPQRASFEVPDDIEALRLKLGTLPRGLRALHALGPAGPGPATLNQVAPGMSPATTRQQQEDSERAYELWRARHPSVLQRMEEITLLLRDKRLVVFLDYDGTLTPIVSNPDEAVLSQQMRDVVRAVARLFPTAIISGRGREKVENFVQLKELYYAGSHGMDIEGPTGLQGNGAASFQPAAHFRPLIDRVYQELSARLAPIPGASVEHNTFCVSAHFRNCSAERWQDVVAEVEQVVAQNPELRITRGRKVVEVRPKVNWHKGTALDHLMGVLGLRGRSDVVALYIGDDHTDEDAFRVLRDTAQGFGVLVSTKVRETAAAYTVRDPGEVQQFLQALVAWGSTEHNAWARPMARGPSGGGGRGGPVAEAAAAAAPSSSSAHDAAVAAAVAAGVSAAAAAAAGGSTSTGSICLAPPVVAMALAAAVPPTS